MLSKREFCRVMEKTEKLNKGIEGVDKALRGLSPDFGGFYIEGLMDLLVGILEKDLEDGEGWLSYFVFERNFLRDYGEGDIQLGIDGDWVGVDLRNWGDVYDFIRRHGSIK